MNSPSKLPYSKFSGAGNTFLLFDNRESTFTDEWKKTIPSLCKGRADGVILVEPSTTACAKMVIFNADGSLPSFCGNGVRCFVKYLADSLKKEKFLVETDAGNVEALLDETGVAIAMPSPHSFRIDFKLSPFDHLTYLNTGVPHTLFFVDDLENIDVWKLGKWARDKLDSNVNFVKKISPTTISIRTFERGVEAETLACGSGATAAAIGAAIKWNLVSPLNVCVRSNDILEIRFDKEYKQIVMRGPAVKIEEGVLYR